MDAPCLFVAVVSEQPLGKIVPALGRIAPGLGAQHLGRGELAGRRILVADMAVGHGRRTLLGVHLTEPFLFVTRTPISASTL